MLRRILARLQLDGELFLLTFPFIELQGGTFSLGPRTISKSPPIVNGSARHPYIRAFVMNPYCETRLRNPRSFILKCLSSAYNGNQGEYTHSPCPEETQ